MGDRDRRLKPLVLPLPTVRVFSLLVLFVSYVSGVLLALFFPCFNTSFRIPIHLWSVALGSRYIELFLRIAELAFPGLVILFLSDSTLGCFLLPFVFMVCGAASVFYVQDDFFLAAGVSFSFFLHALPILLFILFLFLLGENALLRSFALFRFSRSGKAILLPSLTGERIAASLALILMVALMQQFFLL